MRLAGKTIVVTGASSGMGKSMTELFVREGANVVAVARREERLRSLAMQLADAPGKITVHQADVSNKADVEASIDLAVQTYGRLDVLVNNAGVMDDFSPVGDITDEEISRVFSVNLFGVMYAMRKAVQVFQNQGGGGNIINVASVGAHITCAGAIYCSSKAAVTALTKNTAYMYLPQHIRCNAIAPGAIGTEIAGTLHNINQQGSARVRRLPPEGPSAGTPEQVAAAALFLASDESSYINGNVLIADGGWTAG